MSNSPIDTPVAQPPCGVNHLVLNVRDIEVSHRFFTGMLGFRHVGTQRSAAPGPRPARFYSGLREGRLHHHDLALVELDAGQELPGHAAQSLNHLAVEYPSRQAWEERIAFLQARGVPLRRRVARGATHSIHLTDPDGTLIELLFELPRAEWEDDIDAALNTAVEQPLVP